MEAADGFPLRCFVWRHSGGDPYSRPVVIINNATSVLSRYYFRFAAFLFQNGFDVIAYDYRGIGESRPATLRGFDAGWVDWGHLDFDAMLRFAARSFPGQPIDVVGHSVGGYIIGFAPSNHLISRIFTVGAQCAYWPDYAAGTKFGMVMKWHVAMPLLTLLFGYFPGKKLGWLEDTPSGVVRDWALSRRRFEDTWRGAAAARYPSKQEMVSQFAAVTAPTLAVSTTDDSFSTQPAIERLLSYYRNSPRTHLRISPQSIEEPDIGHFGFFNKKFEQKLWPVPLHWLKFGQLADKHPGSLVPFRQSGMEK